MLLTDYVLCKRVCLAVKLFRGSRVLACRCCLVTGACYMNAVTVLHAVLKQRVEQYAMMDQYSGP